MGERIRNGESQNRIGGEDEACVVGSIHMEIDNRTKYRSNQEPSTVLLASYIEMIEKNTFKLQHKREFYAQICSKSK